MSTFWNSRKKKPLNEEKAKETNLKRLASRFLPTWSIKRYETKRLSLGT